MRRVSLLALVPAFAVALVVSLAAAAPVPQPDARATAVISRIVQPGLSDEISLKLAAPSQSSDSVAGYVYPEDGSVLRIGSADARVAAQAGVSSSAQSGVGGLAVSLFGGEITIESFETRASVAAGPANASANVAASSVRGLTVLGRLVVAPGNAVIPLGNWGSLELLGSLSETDQKPPRSARATVTAVRVRLFADHGGLAAGSSIEIGSVSAASIAAPTVDPAKPRPRSPRQDSPFPVIPPDAPREPGESTPGAPPDLVRQSPEVTVELSSGGYVFPIYGPASFGDTFGQPRPNVEGDWHHGEDIFAPLGTPLLAVADGTVFSVGWNEIGGWRLWLRDRNGNEFYYAHLSAFSQLAVNNGQVKAGDVLGFMGKTGDAEFSTVHLHFEIHPVSLLPLGYHGVVAPYPFLNAWRRLEDVSFDSGRAYLPLDGPASARGGLAPPVGAVLLEAEDISSTSGLVPGALEATLAGRAPKSPAVARDR